MQRNIGTINGNWRENIVTLKGVLNYLFSNSSAYLCFIS